MLVMRIAHHKRKVVPVPKHTVNTSINVACATRILPWGLKFNVLEDSFCGAYDKRCCIINKLHYDRSGYFKTKTPLNWTPGLPLCNLIKGGAMQPPA